MSPPSRVPPATIGEHARPPNDRSPTNSPLSVNVIKVATTVRRNGLLHPENPDHSQASTGCGGCTIAPRAYRSCQSERHDDGRYCEAPRLRRDRLDQARGGEVRRTDPESAHALLVQRSPAVALAVPDLSSGSVRRFQSP